MIFNDIFLKDILYRLNLLILHFERPFCKNSRPIINYSLTSIPWQEYYSLVRNGVRYQIIKPDYLLNTKIFLTGED